MKKYEKPFLFILKVKHESMLVSASPETPTGSEVSNKPADSEVAPLAKEGKWPSYNVWEDEL